MPFCRWPSSWNGWPRALCTVIRGLPFWASTTFRSDLDALPVIRSHVIDGHAVLPLALILEWLAEGALHRHPGLAVLGIDNLRLHKGVVLRGERPTTVSLHVGKARRGDGASIIAVEMLGVLDNGREVTHARGEVVVAERHACGERLLSDPD